MKFSKHNNVDQKAILILLQQLMKTN